MMSQSDLSYQAKYLKYKNKYLALKKQLGGTLKVTVVNKLTNEFLGRYEILPNMLVSALEKKIVDAYSSKRLNVDKVQLYLNDQILNPNSKLQSYPISAEVYLRAYVTKYEGKKPLSKPTYFPDVGNDEEPYKGFKEQDFYSGYRY